MRRCVLQRGRSPPPKFMTEMGRSWDWGGVHDGNGATVGGKRPLPWMANGRPCCGGEPLWSWPYSRFCCCFETRDKGISPIMAVRRGGAAKRSCRNWTYPPPLDRHVDRYLEKVKLNLAAPASGLRSSVFGLTTHRCYRARANISCISSAVSSIGFPFMLLATEAISTRTAESPGVRP